MDAVDLLIVVCLAGLALSIAAAAAAAFSGTPRVNRALRIVLGEPPRPHEASATGGHPATAPRRCGLCQDGAAVTGPTCILCDRAGADA